MNAAGDSLNIDLLNEEERPLWRAVLDARALVLHLKDELEQAEQRLAEAQGAMAVYYGGTAPIPLPDESVKVWITGMAGEHLKQMTTLSDEAREAVDAMTARTQGYGEAYRLVAPRRVAVELAKALEAAALDLETLRTKKSRADAASVSRSAARIRQAL